MNKKLSQINDEAKFDDIWNNYTGWRKNTITRPPQKAMFFFGDVNLDGVINNTDALLILKYVTKTISLSNVQKYLGDIDCNGEITAEDSNRVLRIIVGLEWSRIFFDVNNLQFINLKGRWRYVM